MPAVHKAIDAHVGGQPLRLLVEGYPSPRGDDMLEKRDWARAHADGIRRALLLEPRGHQDMCGAVLTEPILPGSHAGVLFMHNDGYPIVLGHGIIAVTRIALERGLLVPGGDGATVIFDTPAGTVRARARDDGSGVSFQNVPSFVMSAGLPIRLGTKEVRADVVFSGGFFAIVDSEAAGLGVHVKQLPELRRAGVEIGSAVESACKPVHPLDRRLHGIDGTIFTAPADNGGADLRSVTVFASGAVDRSPGGTATGAIMCVLSAMGLLDEGPFVHESVIGTRFVGRVAGSGRVGEYEAIVPEIAGAAWITGEHSFLLDERDPLGEGFCV